MEEKYSQIERAGEKGINSDYYYRKYIQYLLLEGCKYRDFSVLNKAGNNCRAFPIQTREDFEFILKYINWERCKQNLYVGCARLKNIPRFTLNPKERSSQTGVWYKEQYSKEVATYDLFFDFDKKEENSWEEVIQDVKHLKEYLEDYKVPYFLIFSGGKGFQIIIDGNYCPVKKIEYQAVFPHKTITEKIKKMLNLKFLDLSINGVESRLRKLPYSIVGNNVALPLSDNQLNNFEIENMSLDYVCSKITLIRRGNLERFSELPLEIKKCNVDNFIKVFSFK